MADTLYGNMHRSAWPRRSLSLGLSWIRGVFWRDQPLLAECSGSLDYRFKVKTVLLNSIKSTQLNTIDFN